MNANTIQETNQISEEMTDKAFKLGFDDYYDRGFTVNRYEEDSELGQAWAKGNLEARECLFCARYDF